MRPPWQAASPLRRLTIGLVRFDNVRPNCLDRLVALRNQLGVRIRIVEFLHCLPAFPFRDGNALGRRPYKSDPLSPRRVEPAAVQKFYNSDAYTKLDPQRDKA